MFILEGYGGNLMMEKNNEHELYLKGVKKENIKITLTRIFILIALIALW